VKHPLAVLLALLSALAASGCSSSGGGSVLDSINAPQPADTGPGCYDNKNRLVRTITTAAECEFDTWVWKP